MKAGSFTPPGTSLPPPPPPPRGTDHNRELRDHFAGLAMQALLIRGWVSGGGDEADPPFPYAEDDDFQPGASTLAADAYFIAERMVERSGLMGDLYAGKLEEPT
jgi:hypothetical protein